MISAGGQSLVEEIPEPTSIWAVELAPGADPAATAAQLGAEWEGPIGQLDGWHSFVFFGPLAAFPDSEAFQRFAERQMEGLSGVILVAEQQKRRHFETRFIPADPLYPQQWHLRNRGLNAGIAGKDINAEEAWAQGFTGRGVTVAVVDEGTQVSHPDLAPNFRSGFGLDLVDGGTNPEPRRSNEAHGTAVAGIIAAARNNLLGVGVAFDARLAAVRMLRERTRPGLTDSDIASALSFRRDQVAISNNSWGPGQSGGGIRFAGPGSVTRGALQQGALQGRNGLGTIFVWAAGNSAQDGDNANYDGYNNSIYTISVGAAGHDGRIASYSEPGASVFLVAPSRGSRVGITTTDVTGNRGYVPGQSFTSTFGGTSAAAPIVAGVVALMLEANPLLDWRDVQHILARTAVRTDLDDPDWAQNGVGFWVNHAYGFGRVDAAGAVALALEWNPATIPPPRTFDSGSRVISGSAVPNRTTTATIIVSDSFDVEHVEIDFTSSHPNWGDLLIELISPAGTVSVLSEPHLHAGRPSNTWTFMTVRNWGENSAGSWRLRVTDLGSRGGPLQNWRLQVHGAHRQPAMNNRPAAPDVEVILPPTLSVSLDPRSGALDPDGDPLRVLSIRRPARGEVTLGADGLLRYSMTPGELGTDRFGVTLTDGRGGTVHRVYSLTNATPGAVDLQVATGPGRSVRINPLENDFDPFGRSLQLDSVGQPRRGTLTVDGAGMVTYTPPPGFVGVDRFPYTLRTESGERASAWVSVVVVEEPDFILDFDGRDDVVVTATSPAFNLRGNFTVEAWIRPRGWGEYFTGYGRIFDKGKVLFFLNGFESPFYNDRSLVFFGDYTETDSVGANSSSNVITLNEWQHVAFTHSSGTTDPVRFFVNGNEVGRTYPIEDSQPQPAQLADNRLDPARFGDSARADRGFEGEFGEVRVWNRVLTAMEIRDRYSQRVASTAPGLLALWDFPEGSGTTTVSRGGNVISATLDRPQWTVPVDPLEPLRLYFPGIVENGDGWWLQGTLGWIFADDFPWVYHPGLGWFFAEGSGQGSFTLFVPDPALGWVSTTAGNFPWMYAFELDTWLYYFPGSNPALFFDPLTGSTFGG
ncbi:MAG: S8 family serine peptidase [Opitutales bacterium]|nr:S8 family serine peptidase [Opitutales bacterium]